MMMFRETTQVSEVYIYGSCIIHVIFLKTHKTRVYSIYEYMSMLSRFFKAAVIYLDIRIVIASKEGRM